MLLYFAPNFVQVDERTFVLNETLPDIYLVEQPYFNHEILRRCYCILHPIMCKWMNAHLYLTRHYPTVNSWNSLILTRKYSEDVTVFCTQFCASGWTHICT